LLSLVATASTTRRSLYLLDEDGVTGNFLTPIQNIQRHSSVARAVR
jgi:hypothetical protein